MRQTSIMMKRLRGLLRKMPQRLTYILVQPKAMICIGKKLFIAPEAYCENWHRGRTMWRNILACNLRLPKPYENVSRGKSKKAESGKFRKEEFHFPTSLLQVGDLATFAITCCKVLSTTLFVSP